MYISAKPGCSLSSSINFFTNFSLFILSKFSTKFSKYILNLLVTSLSVTSIKYLYKVILSFTKTLSLYVIVVFEDNCANLMLSFFILQLPPLFFTYYFSILPVFFFVPIPMLHALKHLYTLDLNILNQLLNSVFSYLFL